MLPERIGCDLGSLTAGEARPGVRYSAWIDDDGALRRHEITRTTIRVERRLDYDAADQLLAGGGEEAGSLLTLDQVARRLAARRKERGAIFIRRPEWKIRVTEEGRHIEVKPIPSASPSRLLVAEMMILANGIAAREAAARSIPLIYRAQAPPADPLPAGARDDPALPYKLRGQIQPAALSLAPAPHWGLGLEAYTQITSPLRRYADLVLERQLCAALADEPRPYTGEELLKVMATAEAAEQEHRRIEAAVTARWALEHVARLPEQRGLRGIVVGEVGGGYKVELQCCGAQGLLVTKGRYDLGQEVAVDVKSVQPRRGSLRLVAS
jgi:exoribonuclease-2